MNKLFKSLLIVVMLLIVFTPNVYAKGDKSKKSLVALGDSITEGVGVKQEYLTYPSILAKIFENRDGESYEVTNLGVGGWTSEDLLRALLTDITYINAVQQADIIVLNIGSNDFLSYLIEQALKGEITDPDLIMPVLESRIGTMGENILNILFTIRLLNPTAEIIFYNLYNPFVEEVFDVESLSNYLFAMDFMLDLNTFSNLFFELENAKNGVNYGILTQVVCKFTNIKYVDTSTAFKESSVDNFLLPYKMGVDDYDFPFMNYDVHPKRQGHRILANLGYNAIPIESMCPRQ